MASILDDPSETDVVFHLDDGKSQAAHRLMLCSASDFFCRVFEQKVPKVGVCADYCMIEASDSF